MKQYNLIRDLPDDERPEARAEAHGPETLSDSELLALLLDLDSLDTARAALTVAGRLQNLPAVFPRSILPATKARRLEAAIEFARRLAHPPDEMQTFDPDAFGRAMQIDYAHAAQETLTVTLLDSRKRVIGLRARQVYLGTINHAAVSTRDIVRLALAENAVAVVLHHNHPSGDPSPSAEDLMFTRKVLDSLRLCDIDLADHVISGAHRFYSMRQRGQI